ncbi:hypothetical protein JOB18_036396 [Solea senegalensis]|uniref:Uncharacterized protein n=1 Tax=Solea senegalensis TaxID=28829 RepID=A0AAV6SH20_SOLSE|nr:hypothetical protein JOB18_036396 [Solea senegalensis]
MSRVALHNCSKGVKTCELFSLFSFSISLRSTRQTVALRDSRSKCQLLSSLFIFIYLSSSSTNSSTCKHHNYIDLSRVENQMCSGLLDLTSPISPIKRAPMPLYCGHLLQMSSLEQILIWNLLTNLSYQFTPRRRVLKTLIKCCESTDDFTRRCVSEDVCWQEEAVRPSSVRTSDSHVGALSQPPFRRSVKVSPSSLRRRAATEPTLKDPSSVMHSLFCLPYLCSFPPSSPRFLSYSDHSPSFRHPPPLPPRLRPSGSPHIFPPHSKQRTKDVTG